MNWLKQQRLLAALLALLCLALLVLAVPRFMASLYALYPESVLSQTQAHLPAETYLKSIKALDDALTWDNNPEYWQAKGICYLALFNFPDQSLIQQHLLLLDARLAITNGLSGSPIDAFAWFRLAVINKMLKVEAVSDDLRLSLYAGSVEPEILMSRLTLAYSISSVLGSAESALWIKQVNIAWQLTPTKLVAFVVENPFAKAWVETAFIYDIEHLNQFNKAYESAIKKAISTRTR
jgi:tetratricopeptide (TPR) repeat protein